MTSQTINPFQQALDSAGLGQTIQISDFDPATGQATVKIKEAAGESSISCAHYADLVRVLNEKIIQAKGAPAFQRGFYHTRFFLWDANADQKPDAAISSTADGQLELDLFSDPQVQKRLTERFGSFRKEMELAGKAPILGLKEPLQTWVTDAQRDFNDFLSKIPSKPKTPEDFQKISQALAFQAPINPLFNRFCRESWISLMEKRQANFEGAVVEGPPSEDHIEYLFPELDVRPQKAGDSVVTPGCDVFSRLTGQRLPPGEALWRIFTHLYSRSGVPVEMKTDGVNNEISMRIAPNGSPPIDINCKSYGNKGVPVNLASLGAEQCSVKVGDNPIDVLNADFSYPDLPRWEYRFSADKQGHKDLERIAYFFIDDDHQRRKVEMPITIALPQVMDGRKEIEERIYALVAENFYPYVRKVRAQGTMPPHVFVCPSESAFGLIKRAGYVNENYGLSMDGSQERVSPKDFSEVGSKVLGKTFKISDERDIVWINLDVDIETQEKVIPPPPPPPPQPKREKIKIPANATPKEKIFYEFLNKEIDDENNGKGLWAPIDFGPQVVREEVLSTKGLYAGLNIGVEKLMESIPATIQHETKHLLSDQPHEAELDYAVHLFKKAFHNDFQAMLRYLKLLQERNDVTKQLEGEKKAFYRSHNLETELVKRLNDIGQQLATYDQAILAYFPSVYSLESLLRFDANGAFISFDVEEFEAEMQAVYRTGLKAPVADQVKGLKMAQEDLRLATDRVNVSEEAPKIQAPITTPFDQQFDENPQWFTLRLRGALMGESRSAAAIGDFLVDLAHTRPWNLSVYPRKDLKNDVLKAYEQMAKLVAESKYPDAKKNFELIAGELLVSLAEEGFSQEALQIAQRLPNLAQTHRRAWVATCLLRGDSGYQEVKQFLADHRFVGTYFTPFEWKSSGPRSLAARLAFMGKYGWKNMKPEPKGFPMPHIPNQTPYIPPVKESYGNFAHIEPVELVTTALSLHRHGSLTDGRCLELISRVMEEMGEKLRKTPRSDVLFQQPKDQASLHEVQDMRLAVFKEVQQAVKESKLGWAKQLFKLWRGEGEMSAYPPDGISYPEWISLLNRVHPPMLSAMLDTLCGKKNSEDRWYAIRYYSGARVDYFKAFQQMGDTQNIREMKERFTFHFGEDYEIDAGTVDFILLAYTPGELPAFAETVIEKYSRNFPKDKWEEFAAKLPEPLQSRFRQTVRTTY